MDVKPEVQKRYICSFSGCTAAYNKQWKLDAHLCKHTGVRPHQCDHDGCGKSFCTLHHLERHRLVHSGRQPFPCGVDGCERAFHTNANRARHVGRVHNPDAKSYPCTYDGCGLNFRKHKQLKAHVCERHSQQPPFRCAHGGCGLRFPCPSKLRRHEKVHRGYPCAEDGCGFTGKTWTEYLKHRRELHRPVFRCDACQKTFRDSWFLQQHRLVHAETRRVLKCPRDGCGRTFTTPFNLQSHIGSFHEGLRPFACTHEGCGKTFAMKQSLQRHGVIHDPARTAVGGRRSGRRSQPRRSLASRLSGYAEERKAPGGPVEPPDSVELVSLLQDATLLCRPSVDALALAL